MPIPRVPRYAGLVHVFLPSRHLAWSSVISRQTGPPVSLNRPPAMEILATWVSLDEQQGLGDIPHA